MKTSPERWIEWIAATATAMVVGTAFVFMTFQTKADAKEQSDRLTRIEEKINLILADRHLEYKGN